MNPFSVDVFKILCVTFNKFIIICFDVDVLGFILGDFRSLWICKSTSIPKFGECPAFISVNRLSDPLCLFSFWNPHNTHIVSHGGISWILQDFSTLFNSFLQLWLANLKWPEFTHFSTWSAPLLKLFIDFFHFNYCIKVNFFWSALELNSKPWACWAASLGGKKWFLLLSWTSYSAYFVLFP
jgi:hypothetical protein